MLDVGCWTLDVGRLSLIGIACPLPRSRASNFAHLRPVPASHGKQWRRCTPALNHRVSLVRRLPLGSWRMPNRTAPRITGSTARSGSSRAARRPRRDEAPASWARSGRWRPPSTSQRVSGLRADGPRKTPCRGISTANQPCPRWPEPHYGPAGSRRAIQPFDLEFLTRLNAVELPQLGGQHNLALGGNGGLHAR